MLSRGRSLVRVVIFVCSVDPEALAVSCESHLSQKTSSGRSLGESKAASAEFRKQPGTNTENDLQPQAQPLN